MKFWRNEDTYITILRTSSSSRYQRLGFKGWAKCPVASEICFVRSTENLSSHNNENLKFDFSLLKDNNHCVLVCFSFQSENKHANLCPSPRNKRCSQ